MLTEALEGYHPHSPRRVGMRQLWLWMWLPAMQGKVARLVDETHRLLADQDAKVIGLDKTVVSVHNSSRKALMAVPLPPTFAACSGIATDTMVRRCLAAGPHGGDHWHGHRQVRSGDRPGR